METWYKTMWDNRIERVLVVRSTAKCVFVSGYRSGTERRELIVSDYCHYHRTYAEARNHLTDRAQRALEVARFQLEAAEAALAQANAIPEQPQS